jgi:radical SAM protein with 4Fe4S-binding SPASM domain
MIETVKDCNAPWTWMVVVADGDVKPCCYSAASIGNLQEATVDDVWNGPVAMELRRFIKEDRIHRVCAGAACKYVQNTMTRDSSKVFKIHQVGND